MELSKLTIKTFLFLGISILIWIITTNIKFNETLLLGSFISFVISIASFIKLIISLMVKKNKKSKVIVAVIFKRIIKVILLISVIYAVYDVFIAKDFIMPGFFGTLVFMYVVPAELVVLALAYLNYKRAKYEYRHRNIKADKESGEEK